MYASRNVPAMVAILISAALPLMSSDIGGEVEPPPCAFGTDGSLISGVPACAGPLSLSIIEGSSMLNANTSGRGNVADPWLLDQDTHSLNSTIAFRGGFGPVLPFDSSQTAKRLGNPTGSGHWFARIVRLRIQNSTGTAWSGFDFELRSDLKVPSNHADSISFGQTQRNPALLFLEPSSDIFSFIDFEARSRDSISFGGGLVRPGESVTFAFLVSDNGPSSEFYLQQTATEAIPEPGTAAMLILGFGAAAARRWWAARRSPATSEPF